MTVSLSNLVKQKYIGNIQKVLEPLAVITNFSW